MQLPPLDVLQQLLLGILLPGFSISLLLGWLLWRYRGAGLALCGGLVAANVQGIPLPWWDATSGLGLLLAALILSLLATLLDSRRPLSVVLGAAWIGLLSGILYGVETTEMTHRLVGMMVSVAIYLSLCLAEAKLSGWKLLGVLAATGLGISIVMIHAHSARLADYGFMWLASTAGLFVASFFTKGNCRGVAGLAAIFIPFVCYFGQQNTFSEVPVWSFALLAVAPLGSLLLLLPERIKHRDWLAVAAWVVLLALAIGLAMKDETVMVN